jgi:hypothetical protein
MVVHVFSLKIVGYDMHSLLDVINYFRHIKDFVEDISPIIIANHWSELVKYGKFHPRLAIGELLQLYFSENILFLKHTMHIIHSYHREMLYIICMATSTFFRYNSWHVGNQCLNPDKINLSPLRIAYLITLPLTQLSKHTCP